MRNTSRLVSAFALVLAPISYAHAQEAGKNLALDFRTTVVVDGKPVVATAGGGLRLDEVVLAGKGAQAGVGFVRGYPHLIGTRLGT